MRTLLSGLAALALCACPPPPTPGTGGGSGSTGGGSGSLGGGSGSTGGGSGSLGGGSGGSGGGSASTGGIGTFTLPGFYDQNMVSGADGRVHLTFVDGAAQNVHYGSCAANCGDAAAWNDVTIKTAPQLGVTTAGPYGLGIDSTGRLHMLIGGVAISGRANETVYATCASDCHTASNWTFLDVSTLSSGDSPIGTEKAFNVTASGRVSFFSMRGNYVVCDANCGTLSSWRSGAVLTQQPMHARIGADGVTHVLATQINGGEFLLHYARCASNCEQSANWQVSPLGFRTTQGIYETAMTVTASGRVFFAFNQGVLTPADANDNRLSIVSCAGANCLDLDSWSSLVLGGDKEAEEGASMVSQGEGIVLVSATGSDVNLFGCDGNCEAPASWEGPTMIDTADAITQVITPAVGSGCANATSGAWWPRGPVVHVTANQNVVVIHNPHAIVSCNGSLRTSPTIGRVITSF